MQWEPIQLIYENALADFDAGMGNDAVARKYRVSSRWVYKLRRQRSETGQIEPQRGKTGPQPKLAAHVEQLTQLVEASRMPPRANSESDLACP